MRRSIPLLLGCALVGPAVAQDEITDALAALARLGAAHEIDEGGHRGLVQALRDARNDQCVAIVASHPDDQYVLPAAWLRLDEGYRVVVVMMTRGEGGQNSQGPEVGDALGALRTLETEACARQLGIEMRYVNRADAGYCRTAAEAFELWGRDATVRELAKVLRDARPDVVLTTHHPAETHGHDLALLDVLPDAVAMAGDPGYITAGLGPVTIDRIFRCATPEEEPRFELPTGDVDPDRGKTYREIAYLALTTSHSSQAPFREQHEFFAGSNRYVGIPDDESAKRGLYDGLPDLFVALGDEGALSRSEITALRAQFDVELPVLLTNRPALALRALELRAQLLAIPCAIDGDAALRVARRADALARVALHAAGVRATVTLDRNVAVPGETIHFTVELSSSMPAPFESVRLTSDRPTIRELRSVDLDRPQPWLIEATFEVPRNALADDPLARIYRRMRFAMPATCSLELGFAGDSASTGPVRYPLELPLAIRPAIDIGLRPGALLLPLGVKSVDFSVRVRRNSDAPLQDRLVFDTPAGFEIDPPSVDVDLSRARDLGFLFTLRVPDDVRNGPQVVRPRIGNVSARLVAHRTDVDLPTGLRVGLIVGVDDASRNVLTQLGCRLELLTDDVLPTRRFDDFDTILIDVRALGRRRVARAELNRLLAFAHDGGRLVILYHKDSELDADQTGQRFWPDGLELHIGKGRITREDAPVQILLPGHVLLTSPNVIRAEDWDGWTQERGLYFASEWSAAYETPIAFADPGHPPETGALLFGRTGRGEFIYCALALHRQLKNLHPGACRLFANLVSRRRP